MLLACVLKANRLHLSQIMISKHQHYQILYVFVSVYACFEIGLPYAKKLPAFVNVPTALTLVGAKFCSQ